MIEKWFTFCVCMCFGIRLGKKMLECPMICSIILELASQLAFIYSKSFRWFAGCFIHYVVHFGRSGNKTRMPIVLYTYTYYTNPKKKNQMPRTSILQYENMSSILWAFDGFQFEKNLFSILPMESTRDMCRK